MFAREALDAQDRETSLTELGNVPARYQHEWRVATPAPPQVVPNAVFKWTQVRREGVPVPDVIEAEARQTVIEAVAAGTWDQSYGLNIAILHVSTEQAFLLLGVRRGHQELWLRIYAKDLQSGGPFERAGVTAEDAGGGCVWELGVICHERMAWHRYLFSARTDEHKRAWLEDAYSGRA
jgi:hypothetical protein